MDVHELLYHRMAGVSMLNRSAGGGMIGNCYLSHLPQKQVLPGLRRKRRCGPAPVREATGRFIR